MRQVARRAVFKHWGAILGFFLMSSLLMSPILLVGMQIPKLLPGSPIAASLAQLAFCLVALFLLAPYTLGFYRQIMEISRNRAPRVSYAFSWFKDSLKRRRAYGIMAGYTLLMLPLQLVSWATEYFYPAAVAHSEQRVATIITVPLLVWLLTALWGCCLMSVLFLQAANPTRPPAQCLKEGLSLFFRHFGRFFKMQLMIYLQFFLLFLAGFLVALVAAPLMYLSESLFILVLIPLFAGLVFGGALGSAYEILCTFLLTREIVIEETKKFKMVD